jgi:hypothetical protein
MFYQLFFGRFETSRTEQDSSFLFSFPFALFTCFSPADVGSDGRNWYITDTPLDLGSPNNTAMSRSDFFQKPRNLFFFFKLQLCRDDFD